LLEDSDENVTTLITNWLADESRVTANKLILDALQKGNTAVSIESLDDIRDIVNITLGSVFKNTSTIITNDYGINWLDKLKDANGRPLLQPNIADPTKMYINFAGTLMPVLSVPVKDLPNLGDDSDKLPFIIGDLKEAVIYYQRKGYELSMSREATINNVNAFENDLVYFKGSEREDCIIKDKAAYVYATLTVGE
jgi:HK97 family phage major capsid protein